MCNLFQCPRNAIWIARVLHRACISKKFALSTHRRLNNAAKEVTNNSNDEERNTNSESNGRVAVLITRLTGIHLRTNQNSTNH